MRPVRQLLWNVTIGLIGAAAPCLQAGCQEDRTPPPRNGPNPPIEVRAERDPIKPLPDPTREDLPTPPFHDVPLIYQRLPEQRAFLEAYNAVHRPKIAVFVNRTLEGEAVPAGDGREHTERTNRTEARGPGFYSEHTDVYLRPGEYDEAWAKSVDYAAIETVLTDWLSADHQVTIISPATVRDRLSEDEMRRLQAGRPRALSDVARDLNTDILVQVQCHPTRQTREGLEVRLIAEAMNVGMGGESLGRATTLIPPPLDSQQINKYTRFIARKLMSDMTATWSSPGPAPAHGPAAAPAPDAPRPDSQDTRPPESPSPGAPPAPPPAPSPAPSTPSNDGPPAPPPSAAPQDPRESFIALPPATAPTTAPAPIPPGPAGGISNDPFAK